MAGMDGADALLPWMSAPLAEGPIRTSTSPDPTARGKAARQMTLLLAATSVLPAPGVWASGTDGAGAAQASRPATAASSAGSPYSGNRRSTVRSQVKLWALSQAARRIGSRTSAGAVSTWAIAAA